jgi:hypothetical protein
MSPISRCRPIVIRKQRTVCWALLLSAPLIFGSAHGAMRRPAHSLVGLDLRRRYRLSLYRVSVPHVLCL